MIDKSEAKQYQELPIALWLNAWHKIDLPKQKVLTKLPSSIEMKELKKWMEEFWKSKPLPLSIGQREIFEKHNTDPVALMTSVKDMRNRCGILSFAWKVINRKLHVNLIGRGSEFCPWCGEKLHTQHIINGECPALTPVHGHYKNFLDNRGKRKEQTQTHLIHLWSLWKAWCYMQHADTAITLTQFQKTVSKYFQQEMERLKHFKS
jgi:hypothetical protein